MLSRSDLHSYQNRAVQFIKDKKRCALWLFLGAGKSPISLTAASDLIESFEVSRVLVIAPLRVAQSVWKQEASKWSHTKHLSVSVATGSEKNRLEALCTGSDVTTINRENVQWLVNHYKKKWPFDMVIIDESQSFKSAASQRFKALKKIIPMTDYMVLLTGTPSPNGMLDLWSQMFLIDSGAALGRTMTAYKNRFFESDYMGYNYTIRPGQTDVIQELVRPYVLSMDAADYLEMPDRIDLYEVVTLTPKQLKQYRDFQKTLLTELVNGEEVEAVNAAVLAGKLLQMANGALYHGDEGEWQEVHAGKVEALADIIERDPTENLLVAYNFKSDIARITEAFPDAVVLDKDPETINKWNRGEIKMLLAHPASASAGLNLQAGGSVLVWFGLPWSLEYYQQFNGRLHRQGQTKPVRVIHIITEDTIDSHVMAVLNDKEKVQTSMLSALRTIIAKT